MKKLKPKSGDKVKAMRSVNKDNDEKLYVLKATMSDECAINAKMKILESKLFGLFSPVKYNLVSKRKVYVPYELIIFHYEINKNEKKASQGKRGRFDRFGEIAVIYDLNEEHVFHFDLYEADQLNAKMVNKCKESYVLPDQCTSDETLSRCEERVRWKMLNRVFRTSGELNVEGRKKFYRQAWEMTVECRGKTFIKYAYLDNFTSSNEHISGLKVRLEA